jgi:cytochrome P450
VAENIAGEDIAGENAAKGTPPTTPSLAGLPMAETRSPAYAMLREAGPVTASRHGTFTIVSSEAAEFAFKHPELFSSRRAFDEVGSPLPLVPIAFDPPEHTRYRRILQPFFSPRGIASWAPAVRALAAELIDGVARRGRCDLVAELAVPLPTQVFLTLFGLPLEDQDRLTAWKDGLLHSFTPPAEPAADRAAEQAGAGPARPGPRAGLGPRWRRPEAMRNGAELYEYLVSHIARRRQRDETSDLLGQLLADSGVDALDDGEILGLSFLFVLAGLETVTSALSTAFALLAAQPPLRRQIAADPGCIPDAVEELLRFDGPVVFVPRIATRDVTLAGQLIPAGARVNITLAVASRDPAEHPDPDTINLRRGERHLAFGAGPHRCLGSHLARMELRATLEEWHRRIPDYELAPGVTPRVTWPNTVVSIASLPLVFPPDAGHPDGGHPDGGRAR